MNYQEIMVKTYFSTGNSDIMHIYPKLETPYNGFITCSGSTAIDLKNGYYTYSYAYINYTSGILNVIAKYYVLNVVDESKYMGYRVFVR